MVRTTITLLLITILLARPAAADDDCIDYSDCLHVLSSCAVPDRVRGIAVRGDTLYMACGDAGLQVAVLEEGPRVRLIGSAATWDDALDVEVLDDVAYVADSGAGLQVFDISDATAPRWLAHLDTPGWVWGIAAGDGAVYLYDDYLGMMIINTVVPQEPRLASIPSFGMDIRLPTRAPGDCLVAACDVGVAILDIRKALDPELIAVFDLGLAEYDYVLSVTVHGDLAAVGTRNAVLHLLDISDPVHPVEVGHYDIGTTGQLYDIALTGDLALVLKQSGDLVVLDISDVSAPVETAYVRSDYGGYQCVAVAGNCALTGAARYFGQGRVDVFSLANPFTAPALGRLDLEGVRAVAARGDVLYAACNSADPGLAVIDLSDPTAPQVVNQDTVGYYLDVAVKGDLLYALRSRELHVYDISVPDRLELLGTVDTGMSVRLLALGEDLLCVGGGAGIQVYDLVVPEHPSYLSHVGVMACSDIEVKGEHLFIAADIQEGLQAWDLSNTHYPIWVASAEGVESPRGLVIDGDLLYVCGDGPQESFQIFDITVLSVSIPRVGSLSLSYKSWDCAVGDGQAYIADDDGGVRVVDVTNPAAPRPIGTYGMSWFIGDVFLDGRWVVAIDLLEGIDILWPQCSLPTPVADDVAVARPAVLHVSPNPCNPRTTISWSVARPQHLEIVVFDLAGRRLATLADRFFAAGPAAVDWDGCDQQGHALASGVYLVSLFGESMQTSARVCLLR